MAPVDNRVFWFDGAAEALETGQLIGDRNVDLVIVGGGTTGCAAALAAAEQGGKVVLLEAGRIGGAGSGRNIGLVTPGLWSSEDQISSQLGDRAAAFSSAMVSAPEAVFELIGRHNIQCALSRNGNIQCFPKEPDADTRQTTMAALARAGIKASYLDSPQITARTGSAYFPSGIHFETAGTIQPHSYCRGLARAAAEAGAQVFEHKKADAAERVGNGWAVWAGGQRVTTSAVIVATDSYHSLLQGVSVPRLPVLPFYQAVSEVLPDDQYDGLLPSGSGIWEASAGLTAVRRVEGNRLLIGGVGPAAGPTVTFQRSRARARLGQIFPRLRPIRLDMEWSGRVAITHDRLPKILSLEPSGYAVFGFSGRGIAPGTVLGSRLAEACLAGDEAGLPLPPISDYGVAVPRLKSVAYAAGMVVSNALRSITASWPGRDHQSHSPG